MFETYSATPDPQSLQLGDLSRLPRTHDSVAAVSWFANHAGKRRNTPAILRYNGTHAPLVAPTLTHYLGQLTPKAGEVTEYVRSIDYSRDVWGLDAHAALAGRQLSFDQREYLTWYTGTVLYGLKLHGLLPEHVRRAFASQGFFTPELGTGCFATTYHRVAGYVRDHGYLPSRTEPGWETTMASSAEFGALVKGLYAPTAKVGSYLRDTTPWLAARGLFAKRWVVNYQILADHFLDNGEPPTTSRFTGDEASRVWVSTCQHYASGHLNPVKVALLEALPGYTWWKQEGTKAQRRFQQVGPSTIDLWV